jgi:cytochrome c oxidase assembly protein subunit 15
MFHHDNEGMPRRWSSFQRLALATTATTYLLILVGGLVRASGAGLGCPDWPRCFGGWIPPASAADLPPGFDPAQFNPTLMWTEYLNRLLGMIVGLLILATVVSAWRHHRHEPRIFWTSVAALLLTGFQGWLGGQVVEAELAPWIVTTHMIVALVIVSLLLYATVVAIASAGRAGVGRAESTGGARQSEGGRRQLWVVRLTAALMALTLVQIAIGTQVRGRVDQALDAGTARDLALATVGRLDTYHRDFAIAVAALTLVLQRLRRDVSAGDRLIAGWITATFALMVVQIGLGVVMAYMGLPPAAQVLHLAAASLLLGAQTVVLLLALWHR